MKKHISKKTKIISLSASLTIAGIVGIIVTSCGPSAQVVNQLFPASSSIGFGNFSTNTTNEIVTRSLMETSGFEAFLNSKLADVLESWYKNNGNPSVRSRYQNFVDVVDDDYKKLIKDLKESQGNDYLVELQKNYFDQNGGTEASYKKAKLNEKIFNDFTSQIFNNLFLNYVGSDQKVQNPTIDQLRNSANWNNIKFTNNVNGYVSDNLADINNVNQTYAQIQNEIFSQWVQQENPNLLSIVSFNNGKPKNNGLDLIFNKDIIGTDNLTESYQFQVMENNLDQPANTNGSAGYKHVVSGSTQVTSTNGNTTTTTKTGLDQFVGSNGEIDFGKQYTQGESTKQLMTSSDLFSSDDATIPAGFIQQYLSLINDTDRDDVGSTVLSGSSSSSSQDKDFNVMNNFILQTTTTTTPPSSGSNSVAIGVAKDEKNNSNDPKDSSYSDIYTSFTNVNTTINDTFYESYKQLANSNNTGYGLFSVIKPTTTTTNTDNSKYFILIRTSKGVNLMGIDGGSYYLNQTSSNNNVNNSNSKRDIAKQETFLKFRAMLANVLPSSSTLSYTFNLKDSLSNWFNKNKAQILFSVLSNALDKKGTFATNTQTTGKETTTIDNFFDLSTNQQFKTDFQNLKTKINDYVTSYSTYQQALALQNNVNSLNDKLNSWAKTYSDFEANFTPEKVGIAARLPYVRQMDGNYFGLNKYFINEGNFDNSSSSGSKATPTQTDSLKTIRDNTRAKLQDFKAKTSTLVTDLKLTVQDKSKTEYAQVLFVNSNDSTYDLALNQSLQSNISNSAITNNIKDAYFQNNQNFKNIYNAVETTTTNSSNVDANNLVYGIDNATLKSIVDRYYWMPQWYSSSVRYSFGNFTDQDSLDKIVSSFKDIQFDKNWLTDSSISYYTWLYTLDWLLRDNLVNFKNILTQAILEGTDAAIAWTMHADPSKFVNGANNSSPVDPITEFSTNPNFLQGSNANWYNVINSTTNKKTRSVPPTVDTFNDTSNPYYYTKTEISSNGQTGSTTKTTTNLYGFNGIIFDGTPGIDSNVLSQLFTNYGTTGTNGSLSSFSSKDNLSKYLERINTLSELDKLAATLENRANINLSQYYQTDLNGNPVLSFSQKKNLLKEKIDALNGSSNSYFTKFAGFIGNKKVEAPLATTSVNDRATKVQSSDPVIESGNNRLTRIAAYAMQINYEDVSKIGGEGWVTANDSNGTTNEKRLGLDLDTFLSIVAFQASDSSTQGLAINNLINENKVNNEQTKFTTGDKRLFDSLGVAWLNRPRR